MFVDASAMVAMLAAEAGWKTLAERLNTSAARYTSSVALFETAMAMVRKRGYAVAEAEAEIADFLTEAGIVLCPLGLEEAHAALVAHEAYGKGRHPAALNMGDCFAYACAKTLNTPLLYKGDDFSKTDLA
jgi:ribonuclease VapC